MKHLKYLSLMLLCAVVGLSFTSCSDDNNGERKLSQTELSLIAGQSAKLIYDGNCTWSSDEPLIAEVDNSGNVIANRVGETTIWANDESCKVKVTPQYNTYMEPYMEWGASESEVTNFMNGYQNLGKNGNALGFADLDNEIVYMYTFENNSLSSSAIGASFISKGEEITHFLLERYVPIDVDESSYLAIMISIDKKIGVAVSFNASSGLMMVLYMPINDNSTNTKSIMSELSKRLTRSEVIEPKLGDVDAMNNLLKKFKK